MAIKKQGLKKLFVLDTNVLLHDPNCLFKFEEHDIFLPFITLEELDNHKAGTQDINRNARQVTRFLDQVIQQKGDHSSGYPLAKFNGRKAKGKLKLQGYLAENVSYSGLQKWGKNDNEILSVMLELKTADHDKRVVLVSKDINLRIKAVGLGFEAEDYKNDHVVEDADLLRKGYESIAPETLESEMLAAHGGRDCHTYTIPTPKKFPLLKNEMAVIGSTAYLVESKSDEFVTLSSMPDHYTGKNAVWGIVAKNQGQNFALNLLTNPNIDMVTLLGTAGTGKTLLTLAAGLKQVMEDKLYDEIIFTRATVPMGEEIGFLPGTEEEKMLPWLGALEDNLDVLLSTENTDNEFQRKVTRDLVRTRIKVKSMSFMRGRTFHRKFFIVDEAQNLTPKQMKSLITRAGPGTKVVCLGNLSQIDTPYLSEASSGLSYAVESFKGWDHFGHVILESGERSRLASFANENL